MGSECLLAVDHFDASARYEGGVIEALDGFRVQRQRPGKPHIVAIQKGDVIAGRMLDGEVPGRPGTAMFLREIPDPAGQLSYDSMGFIIRAVVNDDNLVIFVILRQN
jgi:hypothetical protein